MGKSFSYIIYVYMIIDIVVDITRRREGESTGNNQATKNEGMRPPRHQGRPPGRARAIKHQATEKERAESQRLPLIS